MMDRPHSKFAANILSGLAHRSSSMIDIGADHILQCEQFPAEDLGNLNRFIGRYPHAVTALSPATPQAEAQR